MAETQKQNTQDQKQTKAQEQPKKAQAASPRKEEYVPFRELSKEEIKALPSIPVKLERRESRFGVNIQLIVQFHEMFKKVIRNPKLLDERKYNLILLKRKELDSKQNEHVLELPVRFFQRHDADGNIKYRRFEVIFTRGIVVSDFFDFTDDDLLEALELDLDFKEDKDSSKEMNMAREVEYAYFE